MSQPGGPFGYGDAQFDEGKGFSRLAGPGKHHFMALPQKAVDEYRIERRRVAAQAGQVFNGRFPLFFIVQRSQPFRVGLKGTVIGYEVLPAFAAADTGQSHEPRGVAVGHIDVIAVFMTGLVQEIDALAVQVIMNVMVVTSMLPPTGIILPFISWGGNALLIFMGAMGIMLNISRQMPR